MSFSVLEDCSSQPSGMADGSEGHDIDATLIEGATTDGRQSSSASIPAAEGERLTSSTRRRPSSKSNKFYDVTITREASKMTTLLTATINEATRRTVGYSSKRTGSKTKPPRQNSSGKLDETGRWVARTDATPGTPVSIKKSRKFDRRRSIASSPVSRASKTPTAATSLGIPNGLRNGINGRSNGKSISTMTESRILDYEPVRLVNPLAELGPPYVLAQALPSSGSAIGLASGDNVIGSFDANGAIRNGGANTNNNNNNNNSTPNSYIAMNDWLPLHDLWLGPPDTYPISYWARLLGLSVITSKGDAAAIQPPTFVGIDSYDANSDSNMISDRMTKDDIIQNAKVLDRDNDDVFRVPTDGAFASQIWKGRQFSSVAAGEISTMDEDEQILGPYKDPLYEQLVRLNNTNSSGRALILGQTTTAILSPEASDQQQDPLSNSSRRGNVRRRASDDDAPAVVVPITNQEHTRLQLPTQALEELVDNVCTLSNECCTAITVRQDMWSTVDSTKTDHHSVLPELWNDGHSRTQANELRDDNSLPYYSFHTLAQAMCRFPNLSDDLISIVSNSMSKSNSMTLTGVTDGWVAIEHRQLSLSSKLDSGHSCESSSAKAVENTTKTAVTPNVSSVENNIAHCAPLQSQSDKGGEVLDATGDRLLPKKIFGDDGTEQEGKVVYPVNLGEGVLQGSLPSPSILSVSPKTNVSVAAYITYQFVWFRDKSQAVEESELIARVLAIDNCRNSSEIDPDNKRTNTERVAALPEEGGSSDPNGDEAIETNDEKANFEIQIVLVSLLVTFLRATSVWYAVFPARNNEERLFLENYFRMIAPKETSDATDVLMMICDMQRVSFRYAFLQYKENPNFLSTIQKRSAGNDRKSDANDSIVSFHAPMRRWLLRLPTCEETKDMLEPQDDPSGVIPSNMISENNSLPSDFRVNEKRTSAGEIQYFSNAPEEVRNVSVGLRVKLLSNCSHREGTDSKEEQEEVLSENRIDDISRSQVDLRRIMPNGSDGDLVRPPSFMLEPPCLDLMRSFLLPETSQQRGTEGQECEILNELLSRQLELKALEKGIEPRLRSLLSCVIDERIQFENAEADLRRLEEARVLAENRKMLERRKELDNAWQKQLEQDMDAVCDICNDGEVTPDNQILFCDACNVAVHQMCYGIEKVPDGDYFCLPCQRLGRDRRKGAPGAIKPPPQPLPIFCELCPLRQGAFVCSDSKSKNGSNPVDKWVHSVCAKWQGLRFVDLKKPDLVEDVTEIKINFRRHGIKCEICQGHYGAMNKCMGGDREGDHVRCNKWFHITCARAVGSLRVIHGENCKGPVKENPWRLMCPEHSNLSPDEMPIDAIPVDKLVLAAQEFPPEPKPPPEPVAPKPFNTATGSEREYLLAKPEYENALTVELLTKKFYGVRCEVCDLIEDDSKNLTRCACCLLVFCNACKIKSDDDHKGQFFYCPSCIYIGGKRKSGEESFVTPQCVVCYQKGGFLRKSFAEPVSKKAYWKANQKEYKKTFFAKQLWVHSVCAFWHPKLILPFDTGVVNLSNAVLSNGKALVENRTPCYLCGQFGGMKMFCKHEECRMLEGQRTAFHITCARQAGLEVGLGEGEEMDFYGHCYRHGSNTHNLRARLEDMIEVEKRRSGKDLSRSDAPMKFSNASKILNAGVQVMRVLGWAWRWTEWWVDFDSSWEPLLEPGQREDHMTKEELKIVDSTRESRCADARRCRLAAFGAAVRNRDYDTEDGFDNASLHRALRAVLLTKSLVGPLENYEIDFFVDWLGRAYRSKSRLLFTGDNKNAISEKSPFCTHSADQSPKFILQNRPLPGTAELRTGQIFEPTVDEPDDFVTSIVFHGAAEHSEQMKSEVSHLRGRKRKLYAEKITNSLDQIECFQESSSDSAVLSPLCGKSTRGRPKKNINKENPSWTDEYSNVMIESNGPKLKQRHETSIHKKTKRQSDDMLLPKTADSTDLLPKTAGSTDLSLYDIGKWNASDEAKIIFLELAKIKPYIQALVVAAAKRGVCIEQANLKTGEQIGNYKSMTTASVACGIHRDIMAPILRGEQSNYGDLVWRYVYKPEKDENLRRPPGKRGSVEQVEHSKEFPGSGESRSAGLSLSPEAKLAIVVASADPQESKSRSALNPPNNTKLFKADDPAEKSAEKSADHAADTCSHEQPKQEEETSLKGLTAVEPASNNYGMDLVTAPVISSNNAMSDECRDHGTRKKRGRPQKHRDDSKVSDNKSSKAPNHENSKEAKRSRESKINLYRSGQVKAAPDDETALAPQLSRELTLVQKCGRRLRNLDSALRVIKTAHPWKKQLKRRCSSSITYTIGYTTVVSSSRRAFHPPLEDDDDDDLLPISHLVAKSKSTNSPKARSETKRARGRPPKKDHDSA